MEDWGGAGGWFSTSWLEKQSRNIWTGGPGVQGIEPHTLDLCYPDQTIGVRTHIDANRHYVGFSMFQVMQLFFSVVMCDFARCGRGLGLTICGCAQSEVFATLNIRVWSFVCPRWTVKGTLPSFLPSFLQCSRLCACRNCFCPYLEWLRVFCHLPGKFHRSLLLFVRKRRTLKQEVWTVSNARTINLFFLTNKLLWCSSGCEIRLFVLYVAVW